MAIRKTIKVIRGRTVSRDLILGLTSTLVIIISMVGILYYTYAASIEERNLETYADQVTLEFSQNIALPLFNFNVETVRHIARASLQSESLVGVKVSVDSTVVFEHLPQTMADIFSRESKVVWDGETVGAVNLLFTRVKIEKERRSWLKLLAFILLCVILANALATHYILKSFLTRPLQRLSQGIRSIADGDYSSPLDPVTHSDINAIVDKINRMASQITQRSCQLTESEEKYRRLYENALEGMYKTSADGRFLEANATMAATLGYDSPDDLIRNITDIGSQLYVKAEQRQEYLYQLEKKNLVQGFELEFYRKDGSRIWVEINSRAIHDPDNGKLVGLEGFMVDITLRKQMENDLREFHKELENRVTERTNSLREKTEKLERMNSLFVDRELRMKELKAEIEKVKAKLAERGKLK